MIRKISTLALMACLASSLAFAGEKDKSKTSAGDVQPAATEDIRPDQTAQDNSPCDSKKDNQKDKQKVKPTPSNQEREFNKVLQGIYG